MQTTSQQAKASDGIRPFFVNIPQEALSDLKTRVRATRWPDRELVNDQSQGVQLATMMELVRLWGDYDWRKVEARLNSFPQFITNIDGLDIHFIHSRSKLDNALPLIVTHGWPGSIIEQLKIIEPLTNPTANGASASDAFHLVIPSLPGYGFSGRPNSTGWDPAHIAHAWTTLMKRLGYNKFVAAGGDWGSMVTDFLGKQAPPELLGIHNNMPATVQPDISKVMQNHDPPPANLTAEEKNAYNQLSEFFTKHLGYAIEMGTRPQTLYGLADSPAAIASWMIDHDPASYELIARAFDGHPGGLSTEDILENISLYWLTNTGVSSGRLYWENKLGFFDVKGVTVPAALSVFPDELYQAPRSWAEKAYPKMIYYNRLDRGGHFAAWEQPQLYSEEIRKGFRSLRK